MLRSIFAKTVRDERRALLGWGLGIAALALWIIVAYPSLEGRLDEFEKLVASYPAALKAMFSIGDLGSASGYLQTELFGFMVPVLFAILAILAGSDAISGEEDRGTLDLLLANPVRRERVVVEKFLAVTASLAAIGTVFWLVLAVGASAVGMGVSLVRLADACFVTTLLGVLFGALSLALGCATGRRGLSRGCSAAIAVLTYFAATLGPLVSWMKPLRPLSPYYHAVGADPLRRGLGFAHVGFLVGVTVVLFGLAILTFRRRDLAV